MMKERKTDLHCQAVSEAGLQAKVMHATVALRASPEKVNDSKAQVAMGLKCVAAVLAAETCVRIVAGWQSQAAHREALALVAGRTPMTMTPTMLAAVAKAMLSSMSGQQVVRECRQKCWHNRR